MKTVLCSLIALLTISHEVFAEDLPEMQFAEQASEADLELYEQNRQEAELVTEFVETAFSDVLWGQDTGLNYGANQRALNSISDKSIDYYQEHYPWYLPYIREVEKIPKSGVVHKWPGPIKVSLGWPDTSASPKPEIPARFREIASSQIEKVISQIRNDTSLDISFSQSQNEYKNTEDVGIRIVPSSRGSLKNYFKEERGKFLFGAQPHPETYLIYSKRFTPFTRSQVEGFLVPKPDNSIGIAVCKVNHELPETLMRALITECMVRTLGFPSLPKVEQPSALSNWNAANDVFSKRPIYDGEDAKYIKFKAEQGFQLPPLGELKLQTEGLEDGLTEHDLNLISILYCEEIKAGMDKFEATQALFANDNCLSKLK